MNTGGMRTDDLCTTGPAINCFLPMNLGLFKHLKFVLINGDFNIKVNTQDW